MNVVATIVLSMHWGSLRRREVKRISPKGSRIYHWLELSGFSSGSQAESESISTSERMSYDVFLSFRGEDTRANFTSHLYTALQTAGIYVFRDDDEMQRGDQISVSLFKAIRQSRIFIIVFSENYANSRWCMLELENIIEVSRAMEDLRILPVFYKVDPQEVRRQTGKFGKGFKDLISIISDNEKKSNWETTLVEVGNRAGFVIRNESEDIKMIVKEVTNILGWIKLHVADHPVGVDSRVQDVIQLLNNQKSKDPILVGIWGMAGIGKTTLAKASYNEIHRDFEAKSFLLNVRKDWEQENGKVSLQQRLLSDIYKTTKIKIDSLESGKMILKERLSQKRIFLVLDDVNKLDQLNALCGSREWFGQGSIIIITTKDGHLLDSRKVDHVYRLNTMSNDESLELFCWHAFEQSSPIENFTDISRYVVNYCRGLPLALQVMGSFLLKRSKSEWEGVLEKLKHIPDNEVLEKLRISFDALSDDDLKEIFLHIAFFFIGMDKEDVSMILKECGHYPEIGIPVLEQQSLITVDKKNMIGMHDLLRDMGREIVRQKSTEGGKEPSRLWRYEDVRDVLSKDARTVDVEGVTLMMSEIDSTASFKTKDFEKMDKLKFLQLEGVQLDEGCKYLSRDLRWLYWHRFPLEYIPEDYQESLVAIDLTYSNLERVWRKSQLLKKLKILNLSHSHKLKETPDFSNLPNLEKLILIDCPSLSAVSTNIGHLNKLLLVNLKDCTGLCELPKSIYKLESAKTLILSGCTKIEKLEEDIEQMKSLTTLVADKTAITRVPFAVARSKSIKYISLCGYEGFTRDEFQETRICDVFLSFSIKDTRARFISHLQSSLQNDRINVFIDDDEIQQGDQISVSLLEAIRHSRISIVVLSGHYASSRWCMLELETIMEMGRARGLVIVPVFYELDPSEVQYQTGKFGEAFKGLISRISDDERKRSWEGALLEVGGIAGVVVLKSRSESVAIKRIVEVVTYLLDTTLFVADYPVGIESRVQHVIQHLNNQQSKDPLLVGIWGMAGIGKTTIAKASYNEIRRDFEAKGFLFNVREVWEQENGKVSLQQRLLSDIYKTTKIKIDSVDSGKMILKERLSQKRIFLVLDDVNKLDQLNALCGSREWFGQGSIIIITTKDEYLLNRLNVDHVFRLNTMNDDESLELFSWHAFNQPSPIEGFTDISRDIVKYSGGLPCALEVIGSFLSTRQRKTSWKNVLEKLKLIPNDEVLKKLRISFDGLSDDGMKELFLDIAFYFIGMDQEDVTKILKECGHYPEIGIHVLGMHGLLRDMGREIVRKKSRESGKEPSRLWRYEDVHDVLSKDTKTVDVKGVTLKMPEIDSTASLKTKDFEKLDKLKFLQLDGVQLDGDYKYLSRDLRWLSWHGFPLKYIPADFYQGSLVAIDLKYSNLERVWRKSQLLKELKILNLSHSHNLRETPDFSNLPNLEKLILKDCPSLSSVSSSIGHLNKVLLINLKDCTGLRELPRSIYKLESVKTLILSGCTKIDKLEEDIEQMKSLTTLVADNTAIIRVPFAVVKLKSIGYISLCGYEGFARDVFPSIIQSWISPTNNILPLVQTSAGTSSLDFLNEQNSSFHCLPSTFKDLQNLQRLWLTCDSKAQRKQTVASILGNFYTKSCEDLKTLTSLLIQMGENYHVTDILRENISQKMLPMGSGLLPGDKYPNWLTFNGNRSSVSFKVPQVDGRSLKTIMCILYFSSPDAITSQGLKVVLVVNCTKNTILVCKRDSLLDSSDEEWQRLVSSTEPGDKVKVIVGFENGFRMMKTTVYLIYDEPIDEKTKHCGELDKNAIVSSGYKNIFGRLLFRLLGGLFFRLPSRAQSFLISQPFWFCLAGIMLWWFRRRSDKRRSLRK